MSEQPDGFHLKQEFDARFGSVFYIVERFVKSISLVNNLLTEKMTEYGAMQTTQLFTKFNFTAKITDGMPSFGTLDAVMQAFRPFREMQQMLEHTSTPFIYTIVPRMEYVKTTLESVHGTELAQDLSSRALNEITHVIHTHPLSRAASLLHPVLRGIFLYKMRMPAHGTNKVKFFYSDG